MTTQTSQPASAFTRNLTARLAAVQAVYQSILNGQNLQAVLDEYKIYGHNRDPDEPPLPQADGLLLQSILLGVQERREDLEGLIKQNLSNKNKEIESLLQAILLAASYEIMAHAEVDTPIILNDYLDVTHSFYDAGEVRLVNGVLDAIAKVVRV
jgi:N utilization substance protein B